MCGESVGWIVCGEYRRAQLPIVADEQQHAGIIIRREVASIELRSLGSLIYEDDAGIKAFEQRPIRTVAQRCHNDIGPAEYKGV